MRARPRALHVSAAAREAAGRDDHDEASEAFIAALLHDGRLVAAVGDELAYQKLWNEDHEAQQQEVHAGHGRELRRQRRVQRPARGVSLCRVGQ